MATFNYSVIGTNDDQPYEATIEATSKEEALEKLHEMFGSANVKITITD